MADTAAADPFSPESRPHEDPRSDEDPKPDDPAAEDRPGGPLIGVDIGGSGIKAALVDAATGDLLSERLRVDTPDPAIPEAVAEVAADLVGRLGGADRVGITVPAVVQRGVVRTAANIAESWIGTDARGLFTERLDVPCTVLNDADAAGLAEMRFGAGAGCDGVVIVVTLGTGIGSALFTEGALVANTELGHLELKGQDAEDYAAASVREDEDLSWKKWGHRVGRYLGMLDRLFSPELFVIGGGVSKHFGQYEDFLRDKMGTDTEVVPAAMLNRAGIVGAALATTSHAPDEISINEEPANDEEETT